MRVAFLLLVAALNASLHLTAEQPPLKLADALAWKRIQTPIISNDGGWFAYKLVPNDGDSEIILTHLQDGKEQRFPIGQVMRPNPFAGGGAPAAPEGPPGDMAF